MTADEYTVVLEAVYTSGGATVAAGNRVPGYTQGSNDPPKFSALETEPHLQYGYVITCLNLKDALRRDSTNSSGARSTRNRPNRTEPTGFYFDCLTEIAQQYEICESNRANGAKINQNQKNRDMIEL
jgi:hypothetical protein